MRKLKDTLKLLFTERLIEVLFYPLQIDQMADFAFVYEHLEDSGGEYSFFTHLNFRSSAHRLGLVRFE